VKTVFDTSSQHMVHPQAQKFEPAPSQEEVSSARQQPSQQQPRGHEKPAAYNAQPRVGRNDPCPCGSGKKYKKCCGQ
jgi:preprotein translocase subunit SecA